jgi:hypothetical protein
VGGHPRDRALRPRVRPAARGGVALPAPARLRRAATPGRWDELRALLEGFRAAGYAVVGLEDWVLGAPRREERVLVVRHDVDQHPRSALRALGVHRALGLSAGTWYVRWRTADPRLVAALRDAGQHVGLHFETLSRRALRTGRPPADGDVERCRDELVAEVEAFRARLGPLRSICAHGDTRVPQVQNTDLVDDALLARAGLAFEANLAMPGRGLRGRLTDAPPGRGWSGAASPQELIDRGASPVLCVLHPNNWAAPLAVRAEAALGPRVPAALPRPVRQRPDAVPG